MRWLLLILFLSAFTPIYSTHDSKEKVDGEINHIANDVQSKQFRLFTTTPTFSDIQDGEFVVFQATVTKIMFRVGQELYAVTGSCVTVRR